MAEKRTAPAPTPRLVTIATNLKRLREAHKPPFTMHGLSIAAGLTGGHVEQIEGLRQKDVVSETLRALAKALGTTEEAITSETPRLTDDLFGAGRWQRAAERYGNFRIAAGRAREAGYTEGELDAASDQLFAFKGQPTLAESKQAIEDAREGIRAFGGRPASDAEIGLDAARAVSPKPKKPTGRK